MTTPPTPSNQTSAGPITSLCITRRNALAAGAAVATAAAVGPTARARGELPTEPFHDPSYSVIHPRGELIGSLSAAALRAQQMPRVVKGIQVTGLPEFLPDLDDKVIEAMTSSGIPGVSLALAKDNRLICARGYGRASLLGTVPAEPTMPATIMSVNKPVTVAAALTLVRDKRLRLNDLAFRILQDAPLLAPGQSVDPRQQRIEVHHLMSHTAGLFDVVESLNDPARFQTLAQRGDIKLVHGRIVQNDLVRLGMKENLLFDPGQKYAYSGQGMQVLGRIVEKVSGMRLDRYIQKALFDPLGIRSYFVGSYLSDEQYRKFMRANRENLYAMAPTLYDKDRKVHRAQDVSNIGYVSWGQADACGWGSLNSLDLLRFVSAFPNLVGPEVWQATTERPWIVNDKGERVLGPMGLGWGVSGPDTGASKGISHGGAWPGERSFAGLRPDGGSLAVLVNSDDDPHVDQIVGAARQFLNRLNAAQLRSPSWQDYGFPV